MRREHIYALIDAERDRQAEKWNRPHGFGWGDCSHPLDPSVKATVLTEEAGEVARAVLDGKPDKLSIELVQVAAVAVAWLESLE
jgi:NTP pyrophosphatase (non-canonical NTP hydrolase)